MKELPKRYPAQESEPKWQDFWEAEGFYKFNPDTSREKVFSIDTPPPTVSGALHIGHVFSYTQAECIARYKRMQGFNVFYPPGFDDNGLPTERLAEKEHGVKGSEMERSEFVKLCLETTQKYEKEFFKLWKMLGFSKDWNLEYSTIDDRSRRISQKSFIDLYNKGRVSRREGETLWCVECQTSVAQAELEFVDQPSKFNDVAFHDASGKELVIATTRPELIPACVALLVHPDDERYKDLVGQNAKVPLMDYEVPVLADEKADPEKGTGLVMCCTFGDKTDIEWWKKHNLPLRIVIGRNGHMNEEAGPYAGMYIKKARKQILADLEEKGHLKGQKDITHPVNVHERCKTDIEYLTTAQWFVDILTHKPELNEHLNDIKFFPEHMRSRLRDWIDNLEWDWCISRQRFFGVPFPLWSCNACGEVKLANEEQLPVDPMETKPSEVCACGATDWQGEKDVMDTWATSSVTPQIAARWGEAEGDVFDKVFPYDLRPQAHDIIRTWAFYTLCKSAVHERKVPWKQAMISGFVTMDGGKISKSKGVTVPSPEELIEKYTADQIRYWALSAKLGTDYSYNEDDFAQGKRLVNKLWNACKFALSHLEGYNGEEAEPEPLDIWILEKLNTTMESATQYLEEFEFGIAKNEIERFFWNDFCDNYLEMVKERMWNPDVHGEDRKKSGQCALAKVLSSILKLWAPFLPHITEELYQAYFAKLEGSKSIHVASWPKPFEVQAETQNETGDLACDILSVIRGAKTENKKSMKIPISKMEITAPAKAKEAAEVFRFELEHTGHVSWEGITWQTDDTAKEISVTNLEFVEADG